LKIAAYIGGLLGLALLLVLIIHSDFAAILQILGLGGWQLLWLIPYRTLFSATRSGGSISFALTIQTDMPVLVI
jgi:hypothetical protein